MKKLLIALAAGVALLLIPIGMATSQAYSNSASFTGQGFIADGFGGYALRSEVCAVLDDEGNIIPDAYGQTADAEGPYLLWVLTATGAKTAEITGPWGTAEMTKSGNGTFKFISDWYDPDTLVGNVSATYDGKAKNVQLVVSHGCRPFEEVGAWCSPGFWMNAEDAAWNLTGESRTSRFNSTVYDYFYGATFGSDPTLYGVLTAPNPSPYKGAPVPGTSGYALNAFNATGAYLTDTLPGYTFDWDVMQEGSDDACPIDHHGNWKE